MAFTCCFGGCSYIAEDDRMPFVPSSQNHYIVTKTRRKFSLERDGEFKRLYIPREIIEREKSGFIQ